MRPAIESLTLELDGLSIAGIRQYDPAASASPKMLCIHGWLDNANSFIPLMPHLPAFDLVAIDLPGHGYSGHLTQRYDFHEMTFRLAQIIRALRWDSCHIIGHSLGGSIATMLAVALPDTAESLTLIEATGPLSESASEFPARIRRALKDRLNRPSREPGTYPDKRTAVNRRLDATTMLPVSARLLIDRQMQQTDDGYQWRYDRAWRLPSSQYQTEEQVMAVLRNIECPVLAIVADQGYLMNRQDTNSRLSSIRQLRQVNLPGHHHLHMDTPEPVGAAINHFLQTQPALGG